MASVLDFVFLGAVAVVGVGIVLGVWVYQRKARKSTSTDASGKH